jgi:hypothetical protein
VRREDERLEEWRSLRRSDEAGREDECLDERLGLRSDGVGREDECLDEWLGLRSDGVGREDERSEITLASRSDGTRRPDEPPEMALTLCSDGSGSIVTCCSKEFSMKLVSYSALTSSCNAFAVACTSSSEPEAESSKALSLAWSLDFESPEASSLDSESEALSSPSVSTMSSAGTRFEGFLRGRLTERSGDDWTSS